ncbi:hypothetical protein PGT21_019105 [Puccinia graminis f. sp. tritici]|uniref:Uncharacterized protein n=1 Tax=Puccinia graminis f. sp. tritici TaxID=56615 RepID=A0A5B0P6W8_PUCGR|nr:hypothetical protein PGT21_019105 [Puccinia graminis f. sp. tritici]KAA1131914.1 hypothetical protein PGTUg99_033607 [Puccinia graminis f. sp. tritici]
MTTTQNRKDESQVLCQEEAAGGAERDRNDTRYLVGPWEPRQSGPTGQSSWSAGLYLWKGKKSQSMFQDDVHYVQVVCSRLIGTRDDESRRLAIAAPTRASLQMSSGVQIQAGQQELTIVTLHVMSEQRALSSLILSTNPGLSHLKPIKRTSDESGVPGSGGLDGALCWLEPLEESIIWGSEPAYT